MGKGSYFFLLIGVPMAAYMGWNILSTTIQKVRQYDLLYDDLDKAISYGG